MQFKNARLEDLFHQHLHKIMRGAANEMTRSISNPFQVSGSVEMPSISARMGLFPKLQEKRSSLGVAENYWQSSTWPIQLLYLSTMYYRDYANHLQEESSPIRKDLHRGCASLSQM